MHVIGVVDGRVDRGEVGLTWRGTGRVEGSTVEGVGEEGETSEGFMPIRGDQKRA